MEGIFVVGGSLVYTQLLPFCDLVYVTKVEGDFRADVYFPNLDASPEWGCISEEVGMEWKGIHYAYYTYKRK